MRRPRRQPRLQRSVLTNYAEVQSISDEVFKNASQDMNPDKVTTSQMLELIRTGVEFVVPKLIDDEKQAAEFMGPTLTVLSIAGQAAAYYESSTKDDGSALIDKFKVRAGDLAHETTKRFSATLTRLDLAGDILVTDYG